MSAGPLADHRLNVYLFATRAGQQRDRAHTQLTAFWAASVAGLGLDQALPGVPDEPPAPESDLRAGRHADTKALREMWWDVDHDVNCMSITLSGTGWAGLLDQWSTATADLNQDALLGVAMVFTALTTASHGATFAELPPGSVNTGPGVVSQHGLTVWDLSTGRDPAAERRIAIVAPPSHDDELGLWLWRPQLAPFARYLLNAAKLRYQARVLRDDVDGLRQSRERVSDTLQQLHPLLTSAEKADTATLHSAQRRLTSLQADETGLIGASLAAQAMSRTVEIATANLAGLANAAGIAGRHPLGVYAHDAAIAAALTQDLDDLTVYLGAAGRRAEHYAVAVERELTRRHRADADRRRLRQERFALLQTAIVGTAVMALTAIQAFTYQVPLSKTVQPAIITGLCVLALWLASVALRLAAQSSSHLQRAVEVASLGGICACGAWLVVSLTSHHDVRTTLTWAALAATAGAIVYVLPRSDAA